MASDPGTFPHKMACKPYETYAEVQEAVLQYGVTDETKVQRTSFYGWREVVYVKNDHKESKRQHKEKQYQLNEETSDLIFLRLFTDHLIMCNDLQLILREFLLHLLV